MTQAGEKYQSPGNRLADTVRMLVDILEKQRRHAAGLLELLISERQALLVNDIQSLSQINAEKNAAVEKAARLENICIDRMNALASMLGIDSRPNFASLIELLDQPLSTELEKARSLFKIILLQVRESNKTNQMLLKQCLELVDQGLAALNSLFNPAAVYSSDGNSRSGGRQGLLVSNVA